MSRSKSNFVMKFFVISAILIVHLSAICFAMQYLPEETKLIRELRKVMGKQLYQNYMASDDFLIRWLRARNMNIPQAKQMIEKHLNWRKTNRIDTILDEDWASYAKQFQFAVDGHDKEGRNVVVAHYGSWNPRQAVLAGEANKFQRYLDRSFELAATMVRETNTSNPHHNNTQVILIIDLAGYNLRQHACAGCIPLYLYFVNTYENNWPLLGNKIYLINTPAIFEAMLAILRPIMSPATRRDLRVIGVDKDKWQKQLLNIIESDQLSTRLGGSRIAVAGGDRGNGPSTNHLKRASVLASGAPA